MIRRILVALAAALVVVPSALSRTPVVPSLTPAATHELWQTEVARARTHPRALADAGCAPTRAVFYAQTDWLRLATKLAADPSPCSQYYVSVPPLAADKTQARSGQAPQIRALGSTFHALDEVSWNGWSSWVAAGSGTWYDAGVAARQRMAAAGFDTTAGDTWGLNELSSAVRAGTGVARQNALEFMRGLAADGVRGVVFVQGVGQTTSGLGTYQMNLQNWLQDAGFWSAVAQYASDWAQEDYGDVRAYAVDGTTPEERSAVAAQYLGHELALANAGPAGAATARSALQATYVPFGNAAWAWSSAYGFTSAPLATMEDFVSGQVYAARTIGSRLGFAWAPSNGLGLSDADFTSQTASLLDRMAAAIHDSASDPAAACAPSWCATAVGGAAFPTTWQTFATWAPTVPLFTTAAVAPEQGVPAGPVTVELRTAGVPDGGTAHTVAFSSSSPGGAFAPAAGGPWTPTLSVAVPAGSTSASVWYEDGVAGSPTLTASVAGGGTAAQIEVVSAAPTPSPSPTPSPTPPPQPVGTPAPPVRAPAPLAHVAHVRTRIVAGHVAVAVSVTTRASGVHVRITVRRGAHVIATVTRITGTGGIATWRSPGRVRAGRYTATAAVRAASTA